MENDLLFDWIQHSALAAIVAFGMLCIWKSGKYIGHQLLGNKGKEDQGAVWTLVGIAVKYVSTVEKFTNDLNERDEKMLASSEMQMEFCGIHRKHISAVMKQLLQHEKVEGKVLIAMERVMQVLTDPHRSTHSRTDSSTVDFALIYLALIADPVFKTLKPNTRRNIALCAKRIIERVSDAKSNDTEQEKDRKQPNSTVIDKEFMEIIEDETGDTWDSIPSHQQLEEILDDLDREEEEKT